MRITFLTKRQYMQKDVIDDRYARLYELPYQLAKQGHQVQGICLSYRPRPEGCFIHWQEAEGLLQWHSFNLGRWFISGFLHYSKQLVMLVKAFNPDVLIGCSDCPHVVITAWVARQLGIPFYIDLYDNFASFGLAKIPGMTPAYHRALRQANGVSCVSHVLANYIAENFNENVITLESTIDPLTFVAQDKEQARQILGLPMDGMLMGVAGSLSRNRGIHFLYTAFIALAEQYPGLYLVLAGAIDKKCPPPQHERLRYLGLLDHKQIPYFYSALDVASICMLDSAFGRFAFPQKTYEIMACQTPFVATAVGPLRDVLIDYPACLYQLDNQTDFRQKIINQLNTPVRPDLVIPSWEQQAAFLALWLRGKLFL